MSKLDKLRAALWRAIALTLAEPMSKAERERVIATGQTVEQNLSLTAQLFEETEDSRSQADTSSSSNEVRKL